MWASAYRSAGAPMCPSPRACSGRHVVRGPEGGGLLDGRGAVGDHLGDPEVEDLQPRPAIVPRGQEQVLRLEIAVHNPSRVRPVERQRHLGEERHGRLGGERPAALEDGVEIVAAQQLHHQEGGARRLVDPGVEGLDDVLALDLGGHPRLELEAGAQVGPGDDLRQHHLERATLPGGEVYALVDRPHPAGLEAADDLVPTVEDSSLGKRCRVVRAHIKQCPALTSIGGPRKPCRAPRAPWAPRRSLASPRRERYERPHPCPSRSASSRPATRGR